MATKLALKTRHLATKLALKIADLATKLALKTGHLATKLAFKIKQRRGIQTVWDKISSNSTSFSFDQFENV